MCWVSEIRTNRGAHYYIKAEAAPGSHGPASICSRVLAPLSFSPTPDLSSPSCSFLYNLLAFGKSLSWSSFASALGSQLSLGPPLNLSSLLSVLEWPRLFCWPRSIWTLPDASACSLSHAYGKNLLLNHSQEWSCPHCHSLCIKGQLSTVTLAYLSGKSTKKKFKYTEHQVTLNFRETMILYIYIYIKHVIL
jgi:hypothetical protein